LIAHGEPPVYLTFPSLEALGLPHASTTRHCPGVTAPSAPTGPFGAEAGAVLAAAGIDLARVSYARQVHGASHARTSKAGLAGTADILITTERSLPLAIFTADCLAIILYDPDAGALGIVHSGWRGTVRGAPQGAVSALVGMGARPDRLRVTIGPSIGPCCYEVDAPVVEAFGSAHPGQWERWLRPGRPGHWMLDLWAANEELLGEGGVRPQRIENCRTCTACRTELFYSYRKGHHGRLVTVAALP
jgi:hypothetical protein